MGAIMAGAAYPFLKAWKNKRIEEEIRLWEQQMIITAFLTGSRNIEELRTARMIVRQQ